MSNSTKIGQKNTKNFRSLAICAQFDFKVMCKRPKGEKGIPSNFYEFMNEEIYFERYPSKITLMFERYNLIDSME